jgi:hypothetical protein
MTSTAINRCRTTDGWRPDADCCIPHAAALSAAAGGMSCSTSGDPWTTATRGPGRRSLI